MTTYQPMSTYLPLPTYINIPTYLYQHTYLPLSSYQHIPTHVNLPSSTYLSLPIPKYQFGFIYPSMLIFFYSSTYLKFHPSFYVEFFYFFYRSISSFFIPTFSVSLSHFCELLLSCSQSQHWGEFLFLSNFNRWSLPNWRHIFWGRQIFFLFDWHCLFKLKAFHKY